MKELQHIDNSGTNVNYINSNTSSETSMVPLGLDRHCSSDICQPDIIIAPIHFEVVLDFAEEV